MNRLKIGLVWILLFSIMIPMANAATNTSTGVLAGGNVAIPSPQQIQQANSLAIKNVANASRNSIIIPSSANPLYGYSNGPYLWKCCIEDIYYWGSTTYVPLKVEVWDGSGNNVPGATAYASVSYWNGVQYVTYQYGYQNTGHKGDEARFWWKLPSGRSWYAFIQVYYSDSSGFHYAYESKYFNT